MNMSAMYNCCREAYFKYTNISYLHDVMIKLKIYICNCVETVGHV